MYNPVPSGNFTDGFGWRTWKDGSRDYHTGVDIAAPAGTPILAMHNGVVIRKWWDQENGRAMGGNMIAIQGDDGYETRSAHMLTQSPLPVGARVVGGLTHIGLVGASGAAVGNHLHQEVLFRGVRIDPMPFIEQGPPAPEPDPIIQGEDEMSKPMLIKKNDGGPMTGLEAICEPDGVVIGLTPAQRDFWRDIAGCVTVICTNPGHWEYVMGVMAERRKRFGVTITKKDVQDIVDAVQEGLEISSREVPTIEAIADALMITAK